MYLELHCLTNNFLVVVWLASSRINGNGIEQKNLVSKFDDLFNCKLPVCNLHVFV
jgi:hypothetical protein